MLGTIEVLGICFKRTIGGLMAIHCSAKALGILAVGLSLFSFIECIVFGCIDMLIRGQFSVVSRMGRRPQHWVLGRQGTVESIQR